MSLSAIPLVLTWLAAMAGIARVLVLRSRGREARDRLQAEHRTAFEPISPVPDESMSWIRRWLFRAGFRRREAPAIFLAYAACAFGLGALAAWSLWHSAAMSAALRWLDALPAGIGGLMMPVLVAAPWVLLVVIATWPWLIVRAARRRIVRQVEEDLPITLQILATLARAGLGFDAALARVLESSEGDRALAIEFQIFRRENLAGISRIRSWRRLASRIDVPAMSIFVTAMVHAEQIGGGVSGVLEHQAEDVQGQRRERALVAAQALPVKMVFPLVLCFLPGIFVWTLGPAFYQFLQVIDSVLQGAQ